jgi:L-seryl-tRNA(Ser) seleniumtransferase
MQAGSNELFRAIPSVTVFLASQRGLALSAEFGEGAVKFELRDLLDQIRRDIRDGKVSDLPTIDALGELLRDRLNRLVRPAGRRAINATGILLHTGLGRAPLCDEAIEAMATCSHYLPLQASLDTGDRSLREEKIQRMLIELVGCQAATIVNNNAAATMLILNTLAAGKEVVISRGQLIEIGGSFRMTDVMAQSSATLREVGTTNRTHLRDYAGAINENTGAIIHVHTSNYRIRGFTGTPEVGELVELGRKHQIPVIDDLGSGALVSLKPFGLADEPLVRDSIAAGSDIVCFSGDKLICGPQSGIICGRKELIEKIRKNPYARMFRVCKLTLAGLEATLLHFINAPAYLEKIPFYRMLSRPIDELQRDAQTIATALGRIDGIEAAVGEDVAYVGSGSIPDEGVPTRVVRMTHRTTDVAELTRRLRRGIPSVFGRLQGRTLVLDTRTLFDGEVNLLIQAVTKAVGA